jgi:hypothetical protein
MDSAFGQPAPLAGEEIGGRGFPLLTFYWFSPGVTYPFACGPPSFGSFFLLFDSLFCAGFSGGGSAVTAPGPSPHTRLGRKGLSPPLLEADSEEDDSTETGDDLSLISSEEESEEDSCPEALVSPGVGGQPPPVPLPLSSTVSVDPILVGGPNYQLQM